MFTLPDLVSLTLCNRIEVNPATGEYSLVGLFHSRRFASFPSPVQKLAVYLALHGGTGEGRMKLVIARAETEAPVYTHEIWRAFPGADLISIFELTVQRCVFPVAGRYLITLWFEDAILAQRVLDVFQK